MSNIKIGDIVKHSLDQDCGIVIKIDRILYTVLWFQSSITSRHYGASLVLLND